ncbi:hypothetical protein BN7_1976 [Wickerhamomyces ciferrii]|uniref:Zn(2)-C6 fungal-type domain-containing protein n=1 Tax=Wickerhamomyces ciferrii (strain ATCC 14091 / BCRC 22168 / CBS 111 / JCM 3599 / NBRC 0793 / NRRL Y-1031 F-60-10) TaxID=1206466 RepID=K0KHE4_WICCF|nr:uncharacterized protein BN7_1976 [Wickerhamomyces ciferrii]CCH42431.1 hypothetical protein BN7_1976 [Wickerhamomyces ciferrii]
MTEPHTLSLSGVKRARVAKSCTICRQKKIKCDKVKPSCGNCSKRDRSHLCKYEDPEWNINVPGGGSKAGNGNGKFGEHFAKVRDNLIQLDGGDDTSGHGGVEDHNRSNNQINSENNIYQIPRNNSNYSQYSNPSNGSLSSTTQSIDEPILNFYKKNYGSPRMMTQGVLNWVTLLKKDIYLNAVFESSRSEKVLISVKPKNNTNHEKEFISKYKTQLYLDVDLKSSPLEIPKFANKDLITCIKSCLSDLKLVWILVDLFFGSELYCFLPLFDKNEFKSQLSEIIGPRSDSELNNDDKTSSIKITKRLELSTIGSLLVIMRFSSLSLYNALRFDKNDLTSTELYIYEHPIKKNFISLAQKCFSEVHEFREANLKIFQLDLLIRYYSLISPEDCDCLLLSCTQAMGPLIHSAMINGLNRDPKIAHPEHPNPNLLRRLWYKVLYLDYYQVISTGVPPMINDRFFDTIPPVLNTDSSALDYFIDEKINERNKLHEFLKPLLNLILDVKEPPTLNKVIFMLKPLENYVYGYSKIDSIMGMSSDTLLQRVNKIGKINCFVDTVSLLYMIYYHFYLYHNENQEFKESFHYLIEMIKLMSFCTPLARFLMDEKHGGFEFDLKTHFGIPMFVIPRIELHLHKCIQLLFSILARIKDMKMNHLKNRYIIDDAKIKVLNDISDSSLKVACSILKSFANISDTYYHSWSMQKMHEFIIKGVLKNDYSGYFDPDKAKVIDERFLNCLNQSRDNDGIFNRYSIENLKILDQYINELGLTFKDTARNTPSSASSVDTSFNNLNNPTNDLIWLKQFQIETSGSCSNDYWGLPSTTNNTNSNLSNDPNNDNNNNNIPSIDDSNIINESILNEGVDLFDLDRFFYQAYGA